MFAILSLPSPLHPAVVHFPIVLLLLGAVAAVAAVFIRRWQLPGIAAALFVLGAAGTVIAVQTGDREGEMVGEAPLIESQVDEHEEWAERTQVVAIVVALLSLGAAVITRWPVATRTLGVATALGALVSAWCVIETGHHGGQLVYRHGAGVNLAAASANDAAAEKTAPSTKSRRAHDDDD
jgi:uncharacterized membrane protein